MPIAVKPINVQIAVADGSNTSSTYRSLNWKSASFQISVYAWPTNYFWFAICWQQWGLTKTASEVVTYPIAVSQVYCLLLTTKATTFRYSPWPTKITTKSFQAYSDCEQAYWLLVAKQQWGKWKGSYQTAATITFPIAFGVCYSVCVTSIHNNTGSSYCDYIDRVLSYTNTAVKIYVNTSSFFWIAVGQAQQWGVIPANVGVVTWIYPIKFTSVYSLVTTRYAAYFDSLTQYSDKEMALCYINVDKCRINRGNETTERIYVIAIGQAQQWGLASTKTGRDPVPFPIAFPKAIFSIAACSNYTTFYIDDVKIPTLTGFYTGIGSDQGDGLVWWFAIGKQQWGYYKATSGSYTVTFPIAFSRQTCAVCVTNVNSGAGYPVTYTPNTSSIKITNKCYENFWIAVGFQQWGLYDFPGSNGDKVYFPVAFAVMCAAAIVQPAGRNSHEVTNRTTTYIQGDFRYGDSYKLGTWLAVGY